MNEEDAVFLELIGLTEEDDIDRLEKKFRYMNKMSRQNEEEPEVEKIKRWNLIYVKLICWYNIKMMLPIIKSKKSDALDKYNDKNINTNYKGVSRDLKKRFMQYHYCYNNGNYYFDNNGEIWKTELFDILGIKFNICYMDDKEKENIRFFNQICLMKEKNKENTLFSLICAEKEKDFGDFRIARCRIEMKRLEGENVETLCEKYPFARIHEEDGQWIIDMPLFLDAGYAEEIKKSKKKQIKDIGLSVDKILEKKYTDENQRRVYIHVYNEKKIRRSEILKLGLEKKLRYKLLTKVPKTDYTPVYYALFHSININVFFCEPNEYGNKAEIKLRRFYKKYYSLLDEKVKETEKYRENYWLSEKLFGINFLKMLLIKLNEFEKHNPRVSLVTEDWIKNKTTKSLVDLINILIKINDPELRILYLDIFIDPEIEPSSSIEYMKLINWIGIEGIIKKHDRKKEIENVSKSWKKIKNRINILMETIKKNEAGDKLEKFKQIQEKPDLQFLCKKEYQIDLGFICRNTKWLYKFICEDVEEPEYGWFEKEIEKIY